MELKISSEILKLADRCTRGKRCMAGDLSDPQAQLVGAKRFVCHDQDPCAYKFPFGSTFFCTCPVRQAIYDLYGK